MSISLPTDQPGGSASQSADVETLFANCQSKDVALNGLDHMTVVIIVDSDTLRVKPASMIHDGTWTFIRNGIEGRATFNCTYTFGATFEDTQATGTATWEYPVGTPIKGAGCGPTG